jgi:hypothetical protein
MLIEPLEPILDSRPDFAAFALSFLSPDEDWLVPSEHIVLVRHLRWCGDVSIATNHNQRIVVLHIVENTQYLGFSHGLILLLNHAAIDIIRLHAAAGSAENQVFIEVLPAVANAIEKEAVDMAFIGVASSLRFFEVRQCLA